MIKINNVPVLFTKIQNEVDTARVKDFVRAQGTSGNIVFLDTTNNSTLVALVCWLQRVGYDVVVCSHHDIDGQPSNERDVQIRMSSKYLSFALNEKARISNRSQHPSCSTLMEVGEFSPALCIIADADPDGLMTAMKAVGTVGAASPHFDRDAAILDGLRDEYKELSTLATFLLQGFLSLPEFNQDKPEERTQALDALFQDVIDCCHGDWSACERLTNKKSVES